MKSLDLFAGIGGISLAAEWAGIETVAFCEREPFPKKVLAKRFPGRPIYDDVFDLTGEVLERDGIHGIDLVAGGFPCQPFSNAGKRGGTADDRYLWPQMCRIIDEVRPTWVFAENVDGLVSMAQSDSELIMEDETTICEEAEMVIETIRKDLEVIGYRSVPVVVPASAVGAMHRRYRIFIVGYSQRSGRGRQLRGWSDEKPENGYSELESADVAHSTGSGRQGQGQPIKPGDTAQDRERETSESLHVRIREERAIKPRMGGSLDEFSAWLDGWDINPLDHLADFIRSYPQPAPMGVPQYEWEPPRVATGVSD